MQISAAGPDPLKLRQALPPALDRIIVRFRGGLGNQLFQLAAALTVAKGNGAAVHFATDNYSRAVRNIKYRGLPKRKFDLDNVLQFDNPFTDLDIPTKVALDFERKGHAGLASIFRRLGGKSLLTEFGNVTKLKPGPSKTLVIEGFFQADSWVAPVLPIVQTMFQRRFRDYNSEHADTLSEVVGIHIRRGDYTSGLFDVEPMPLDLVAQARKNCGQKRAIIFTDDPTWAHEHLDIFGNASVWDGPDPIKTFFAMTRCRELIIANSSFSWWAARLSTHVEQVYCPSQWYKSGAPYYGSENYLYPSDWIRY